MNKTTASKSSARRWARRLALTLLTFLAIAIPLGLYWMRTTVRRFYQYAIYANALDWSAECAKRLPPSLIELEARYRTCPYQHGEIGPCREYPRPIYRPPTGHADGRFLVIIEPDQSPHWRLDRLVVYANADGSSPKVENVSAWKLRAAIEADDRHRADVRAQNAASQRR